MNWMRPTDSFYGKYAPIFSKLFEVLYLCVTCAAPAVTVATGGATDRISESRDEPAECADSIHGAKW